MAMRRIIYFLVLTVSFGLFLWWEDYIVHLLFYFLILLPLLSLAISLPLCFLLRCRVGFAEATAAKNREVTLWLDLCNRSLVPALCVRATVICENELGRFGTAAKQKLRFPVGFAAESKIPVTLTFPFCGKMLVHLKRLRVCDPLGIFSLPVMHREPLSAWIYVLPNRQELECTVENGTDLGQESTIYSEHKPGNDPAEIFCLRDYRPGDRPHAIHWKLSARLDRLTVREFGLPLNVSVRFLFELDANAALWQADRLLEAFFSIAAFQVEQRMVLTVHWLTAEGLEERTISDEGALAETLHSLLSMPSVSDSCGALLAFSRSEIPPGCHLIYLTASQNVEPSASLLEELLQSGICRRVSVLSSGGKESLAGLEELPNGQFFSLSEGVLGAGLEEMQV